MAQSSNSSRHTIAKPSEASPVSDHNPDAGDGEGECEQASDPKRTVEGGGHLKGTHVLLSI